MPPELADDRRHRVRTEVVAPARVEAVDGLDQPDRAGLDEILGLLRRPREATGQGPDERQVLLDRTLPRAVVAPDAVPRKQLQRVERGCQSDPTPQFPLSPYIGTSVLKRAQDEIHE
jgi:hypothetical protein